MILVPMVVFTDCEALASTASLGGRVLRASDLPGAWNAQSQNEMSLSGAPVPECLVKAFGIVPGGSGDVVGYSSPRIKTLLETVETASNTRRMLQTLGSVLLRCTGNTPDSKSELENVVVQPVEYRKVGDQSEAFSLTISNPPGKSPPNPIDLFDVVIFRSGRYLAKVVLGATINQPTLVVNQALLSDVIDIALLKIQK